MHARPNSRKRCDCSEPLDANGKCPVCDAPTMRRPGFRAAGTRRALRQQERLVHKRGLLLKTEEARDGAARVLPARTLYAGCEDFVARARTR